MPVEKADRANETLWRRGWRDTIPIWRSWQFILLDALVLGVVGAVVVWYWGVLAFLFLQLGAWVFATARAPVRQRDEARGLVSELERKKEEAIQSDRLAYEIRELIMEGGKVLRTLKSIDSHDNALPVAEFEAWRDRGARVFSEFGLDTERVLWSRAVYIDIGGSLLRDFVSACEAGLDRLEQFLQESSP